MNKGLCKIRFLLFFLFITTICTQVGRAQSYGLGFSSHEVIQDKRTSLELFPGSNFCTQQNFEIAFDLAFLPGRKDYFGYIIRVVNNEQDNIDLIYDVRAEAGKQHFKLVIGGKLTNIAFDLDTGSLFCQWNRFRLQFDLQHDKLVLTQGKMTFTQEKTGLKAGDCFKIYFGASQHKQIKLTDVPPMKIRDIEISKGGTLKYSWPLNEREGSMARETEQGNDAAATNPVWIKNLHYEWRLLKQLTVKRSPSFAFNTRQGLLYVVTADSLYNLYTLTGLMTATGYRSGQQPLLRGNQSLYANETQQLYNIYIDHKFVSAWDEKGADWEKKEVVGPVTDYWHFNKFYAAPDTTLYLFGGYGHFRYRGTMMRYHIPTATWDTIRLSGDKLMPRYLAATAMNSKGDGAYMLGGYGSETGQQILDPKSFYDMLYIDFRKHTVKKLFELKPGKEDFVLANSLVVNEGANTYYGLTYPNTKYSSQLQLIQGSLNNATYTQVGNTIPYSFRDVSSFADLFYCPLSKQLIAVTSLQAGADNDGTYTINIYALSSPPVVAMDAYDAAGAFKTGKPYTLYLVPGIVVILAGIAYARFRKRKKAASAAAGAQANVQKQAGTAATPVMAVTREGVPALEPLMPVVPVADAIYLFGEMQVVDREGADITRQFTPLVKELFLIILLYSVKKGRGVSSEKLTELLWFDKSIQSARNNRSVNIAKLKAILDKLPGTLLSNETGAWKIEIDPAVVTVDYYQYLQIVKNKATLTRDKIHQLAGITQRGSFLSHLEYAWLAEFKAAVSNDIIDTYLNFAATVPLAEDPEFLVKMANDIFYFDPVNEDAMALQCKALAHQGKHSLAKQAFEKFSKEYKAIYGEDFGRDFQNVLDS
jgi:DNA-binding SARP family transcriptional activator